MLCCLCTLSVRRQPANPGMPFPMPTYTLRDVCATELMRPAFNALLLACNRQNHMLHCSTYLRMASNMIWRSRCEGSCCKCRALTNLLEKVSSRFKLLISDVAGSNLQEHQSPHVYLVSMNAKQHCGNAVSLTSKRAAACGECHHMDSHLKLVFQVPLHIQLLPGLAVA